MASLFGPYEKFELFIPHVVGAQSYGEQGHVEDEHGIKFNFTDVSMAPTTVLS